MLRYAVRFGAPIGAAVIVTIILTMQLFGVSAGTGAMAVGYLIMLVALSFIVVAVRQFRDKERGGYIGFWPAFGLGLAIAAVAGVVYVLLWEAYLASTGYNAFMAQYVEAAIEAKRAAGATAAELETAAAEMQEMATMLENPLIRMPVTFTEIFPVGAIVALITALVLRRSPESA